MTELELKMNPAIVNNIQYKPKIYTLLSRNICWQLSCHLRRVYNNLFIITNYLTCNRFLSKALLHFTDW